MYVQIGNDLNLTIGAFAEHQIDLRYGINIAILFYF